MGERIAYERYIDPSFRERKNKPLSQRVLAKQVAEDTASGVEAVRTYFKEEKIPQKWV